MTINNNKGGYEFIFKGDEYRVKSARELMQNVFILLAEEDKNFLENFASERHGYKRRYISKNRFDLYPGRPDLVEESSLKLNDDWWIGTNYGKRDIQKILDLARKVISEEVADSLIIDFD